jgi:hypothetical protein
MSDDTRGPVGVAPPWTLGCARRLRDRWGPDSLSMGMGAGHSQGHA